MHHRTAATVTTLILCACLLLTGCSARARQRDLIRKDPMYSATWDGIESLSTEESTNGGWKPPPTIHHPLLENNTPPEEAVQRGLFTAFLKCALTRGFTGRHAVCE